MPTLSLRARGLVALVVLILFPVLVVLLVGAIVLACGWLATRGNSGAGAQILVLIFPLVLAVGAAAWDVITARRPKPLPGHELTAQEHPALWAELEQMATAMKQPRPDRVVVLPEVNAFVTTAARKREVMIGYPLLAALSQRQLRAVLAHEMGHLAHGHTRAGGLSYRASILLERTVARLDGGQVRRLIVAYYRLYLLIAMSVLRDHERQADAWSARLAGGPDASAVFPTMARLNAVWDVLHNRYLPLAARVGARPSLSEAIRGLTEARQAELDETVAKHLAQPPSRWSTHPGDAERMRQLQAAPALEPSTDQDGPAWQLLGRPHSGQQHSARPATDVASTALLEIEASLLPADAIPATWEQVVHDAEVKVARANLGLVLKQFAAQFPEHRATLRECSRSCPAGPAATWPRRWCAATCRWGIGREL